MKTLILPLAIFMVWIFGFVLLKSQASLDVKPFAVHELEAGHEHLMAESRAAIVNDAVPGDYKLSKLDRNDLVTFRNLQLKVVLTKEERTRKNELLEDPVFIRVAGLFLTSKEVLKEPELQVTALELISAAMVSGHREAADEALQMVIRDNRANDPSLTEKERQELSWIKNEALNEWTSYNMMADIGN